MKKIFLFVAAMVFALAANADPVVLPATLDVSNVSFRSEGMPDFVIEEGQDYAGTYFDMGAHDSANDTLLYAEWDVTIEPINYYIAVDVYNTNSWRVQLHLLNQNGDTLKDLRYKGSSGQCGHYAIGSMDLRDLEAGNYKLRARAATAWSAMKLKDVIFTADYSGVAVNLPGTLLPAYAELSSGASIADDAIAFAPSTAPNEYANWNVSFAEAGTYNVTIDITASNGHNYGVELIGEDEETLIGAVNEGGQKGDTGVKELGAIEVPAAGNYIVHLTNAIQWSEAVLNNITFAAPYEPNMKTIYCKMDKDWWKADGAAVGLYTWDDNGNPKAAWPGERMAPVEGAADVWSFELDINTYHMCIFTRVNGSGDIADWGAKTVDLTIPTDDNNLFTITNSEPTWGDPACNGEWSVYGAEPQPVVAEWAEIVWTEAVEAADLAEDATFTVEGSEFSAQITDPDNKMAIDANTARFGTVEAFTDYTHRLKTGGKTNNGKNFITLNIPAAGQLRIAVRTGSNSATDRNLVIAQGEDTLYNQVIKEDDKTVVSGEGGDTNYYPYVIVPVQAGSVVLTYPVNGLNFYAFGFKADETPEPVLPSIALIGGMNGWDGSKGVFVAAADKASASLTLDLAEMPQDAGYAFKLLVDGVAYGSERVEGNPFTFTRENNVLAPVDHVAVGDDEIFWLVMDVTGEYTFTYTFADSSLVVTYPVVSHTYTVAGDNATIFGTTWDVTNTANDMELQEDNTYKWEKENLELPVGNIAFKVAQDHSWSVNWPSENYVLAIAESGSYTITITFNAETKEVAAVATKTGDADVTPSVAMHGDFNKPSWADTENFTIAEDKASASLTLTLAADRYEFGMRIGGSGNWTANGAQFSRENPSAEVVAGSGNLVLTTDVDGDYTFTWTYETNTLTITFPAKEEGIENTVVNVKVVKTIENGQLVIIKNGVKYNVQGAQF